MTLFLRILIALLLLCAGANTGQAQRGKPQRHAVVSKGFIRIVATQGEVRVAGWDKDSLLVTGAAVEITRQGAKIGDWDGPPEERKSAITVFAPRGSQVWVKTTGANIYVAGIAGGLDLFSVTGSITVTGTPREVFAETMAGQITLTNANVSSARLKTANGPIKVVGNITDLTAVTVSGGVAAWLTTFARARLESLDGEIRYFGPLPSASQMEVVTHKGGITLLLPATTSAEFAFNLYDAELADDFGIRKRWEASKRSKASELVFGVGDQPSARVTIRSFKGPVAIRRMDAAK